VNSTHVKLAVVSLSVASWFATAAHAQVRFDVESLALATASQGSVLNVYGGRTLGRGAYSLGLAASYGRKPLSIESADGEHLGDLVGSVGTLQVLGAYGIVDRFEVGVALPFHRNSAGSDFATTPPAAVSAATLQDSEVAFGDIRVVPRVGLLRQDGDRGVNLGLAATLWLPTGGDSAYAGESFRVEPRFALDYQARSWLVAFNVGYLIRQAAEVLGSTLDDQVRLGAGADIGLGSVVHLLGEVNAHLNVLVDDFGAEDVTSEALIGLRLQTQGGFGVQLAGGPGLTRGLNAPMYRVVAAIGFEGRPAPPEPDPETEPELDADGDAIVDIADRCPQDAEDRDSFQDDDGCPDTDNDSDGLVDTEDRCPLQPEDHDAFQDNDGCPDTDNDADSIADAQDACPSEAGPPATNGCPQPPAAPEPPAAVVVSKEKIELRDTILFGNNNAEIQAQSQALVDAIAKVLTDHPEIQLVSVEGHTDDRGRAKHNQKLSEARAKSVVDALVVRGIAASRLESAGYGASQPIVPNDSDENRAKNRRVELRIERRTE
jgi:outer membrane protein OmpA-like peptidoglycan-associated protein